MGCGPSANSALRRALYSASSMSLVSRKAFSTRATAFEAVWPLASLERMSFWCLLRRTTRISTALSSPSLS